MFSGAKNNKLIGFLKNIDYSPHRKLITSVVGINSVARTCLTKTLKNTNDSWTNKAITPNLINTTFYPALT